MNIMRIRKILISYVRLDLTLYSINYGICFSALSLILGLFQKLFRQDLLVASLFRNFLLAERVMRSYNCTPESHPALPPTSHHPMWQAWDLALDHIMAQLPALIDNKVNYEVYPSVCMSVL